MCLGNNKKQGFIIIEILIIINIIILFIVFYYKTSVNNIKKMNYYDSKSDLMTLNQKEENLINEVEAYINSNEEIKTKFKDMDEMYNFIFTKVSNEDKNLWVEIKQGKIYLVNRVYDSKMYRRFRFITLNKGSISKVMLMPTFYKSDYIK